MKVKTTNRIKVALDPSVIIDLFTLIHPKHDINGQVMSALQQGTLRVEDWKDVDEQDLPKLLQDRSLGHVTNGRYYKLENVYNCLQQILANKVQIHITPTTFFRLTGLNDREMDFLDKHITNLTIKKEDAPEIYDIIFNLARAYIEAEKEIEADYRVFEHAKFKAYVVAEAAVCGLPLITNDMSLIHTSKGGYEISRLIKKVNREFEQINLGVNSKSGNLITPTTMSLASFLKSLEDERYYLYPSNKGLRINKTDSTIQLK